MRLVLLLYQHAPVIKLGEDSDRYAVSLAGTRQYDPSSATGQAEGERRLR